MAAVVLSGFMLGVLVSGDNNLGIAIARLFELDQSGGQLLREFVQLLKFRGRFRYAPLALFFVYVHRLTLRAQASLRRTASQPLIKDKSILLSLFNGRPLRLNRQKVMQRSEGLRRN